MARRHTSHSADRRTRPDRLGFRVDPATKALVESAAELEHRSLTDFCVTALTEAAQQAIARHENLVLSERDRRTFFEALIHPPAPNARLRRAFTRERTRLG